jgi:hypothetical protein
MFSDLLFKHYAVGALISRKALPPVLPEVSSCLQFTGSGFFTASTFMFQVNGDDV